MKWKSSDNIKSYLPFPNGSNQRMSIKRYRLLREGRGTSQLDTHQTRRSGPPASSSSSSSSSSDSCAEGTSSCSDDDEATCDGDLATPFSRALPLPRGLLEASAVVDLDVDPSWSSQLHRTLCCKSPTRASSHCCLPSLLNHLQLKRVNQWVHVLEIN